MRGSPYTDLQLLGHVYVFERFEGDFGQAVLVAEELRRRNVASTAPAA